MSYVQKSKAGARRSGAETDGAPVADSRDRPQPGHSLARLKTADTSYKL